jgi:hypothetical protein
MLTPFGNVSEKSPVSSQLRAASPQQRPHMEMVVIWNLTHLMVKDPLGKLAAEFLLGNEVERFFHIRDFFGGDIGSMFTQNNDRHVARVTIKDGKAKREVELCIPLGIVGKLT